MTDDSSRYEFGLESQTNIRSGHSKVSDWAIIYKTVKDRALCANKILLGEDPTLRRQGIIVSHHRAALSCISSLSYFESVLLIFIPSHPRVW